VAWAILPGFNPFQGIFASAAARALVPQVDIVTRFNPFQGIFASAAGTLSSTVFSGA